MTDKQKPYIALYESGKADSFKTTEYYLAKKRAICNQRKYGRLLNLLAQG